MRKDEATVAQLIKTLMSDDSTWTIAALEFKLGASRTVIVKALNRLLQRGEVLIAGLDPELRNGPRARLFRRSSPNIKHHGPGVRLAASAARDPRTEIINAMVRGGSGK
jgi:hypothetical protein